MNPREKSLLLLHPILCAIAKPPRRATLTALLEGDLDISALLDKPKQPLIGSALRLTIHLEHQNPLHRVVALHQNYPL